MKVGDLVRLRSGMFPRMEEALHRMIGTIIELNRDPIREREDRKVLWFGTGRTYWVLEESLEKVSESR